MIKQWLLWLYDKGPSRISGQLYLGIGAAVALTMMTSMVAWFAFNEVGEAQHEVNEVAVPEIAAAFGVAQRSGTLAAAAPRLTAAETPEALESVTASISEERESFAVQLEAIAGYGMEDERFLRIREAGNTLMSNIEMIEESVARRFELQAQGRQLRLELERLQFELTSILVPAIDNQLFYTVTGYRDIDQPVAPREEYLSEEELQRYRHLADLQAEATVSTRILSNVFNLSDADRLEPLLERFESADGGVERSLAGLGTAPLRQRLEPVFTQLFELGSGQGKIFEIRGEDLDLIAQQRALIENNRDLSVELVAEVESLVNSAQESTEAATIASTQTIQVGRQLLLALNAVSLTGALLIAWLFVGKVLLRRLEFLSEHMRRMAGGDLKQKVELDGRDEVADMAAALEVFRLHSIEAQRLNLVEKLAEELRGKNDELESTLAELQKAQDQIVMREKLAALGELTAGVAHEIQNPLNFVKNFAESSEELLDEMKEELPAAGGTIDEEQDGLIREIGGDLTENLRRIREHGERANRIVRDMLQMGRGSGEKQSTDVNALLEEHARLAYHAARASNADFQLEIHEDFESDLGEIEIVSQEMARVFLNMVNNACHATNEKREDPDTESGYVPGIWLSTRREEDQIVVRIKDNGKGIPPHVIDKIFNPFFTTKPTDQGTGLGLALSNDIVREHGGSIVVDSEPGHYTEMAIRLPMAAVETGPETPATSPSDQSA
ncbi:MAG: HAMP domain-containing protein [Gemmatimonadetes bacterium]|nr:HAMP domain-containing protein [Gemmatimonadota bacterium]MYG84622.1 HAMP domain-containing protein [Gemmatimonadota bacterium]MYJ90593.1 HAMP domain-containing protein [Gemmatimonadota bacterium]